jgi:hypothetical protein
MAYFAREGGVWTGDAAGAGEIQITETEYQDAIVGMLAGKMVTVDGGFAIVDPPEPKAEPEPHPVTAVTRRQIMTGLALVEWITEQEALDALATGARPAAVETVIGSLPEDQRFAARMKWIGFQTAYRDDAMVAALAAAAGKSEQDVDDFFAFCATID